MDAVYRAQILVALPYTQTETRPFRCLGKRKYYRLKNSVSQQGYFVGYVLGL